MKKKLDNLDRSKVIIPLPVRVDQVVPKRPTTKELFPYQIHPATKDKKHEI